MAKVSQPLAIITSMEVAHVDEAIELLEKANADLEPELLSAPEARKRLRAYARAQRLAAFGIAALARKVDDASELARTTGTSLGRAKETVTTGKILRDSDDLSHALRHGEISLDQAAEIARAEESSPGAATELLAVAQEESFHVLKEKARKAKLEAEQHRDLTRRQRAARSARSHSDELGMVNIHLALEPHVGTPIVARAEAEAARLARAAAAKEPFERHLADAYAALLRGSGKGRATRPELVVLVSYEVARRGWKDVREGELCKIPGVGPLSPRIAKEIAQDAFLNGVFYDGVTCVTSPAGPSTSRSRSPSPSSWASRPHSTGSPASTAAIVSAPSSTTSSRAPLGAPPATGTSTPVAGAAINRRPNATERPASSSPQNPDTSRSSIPSPRGSDLPQGSAGERRCRMNVLTASSQTQGWRDNDFCWTVEGELVVFPPHRVWAREHRRRLRLSPLDGGRSEPSRHDDHQGGGKGGPRSGFEDAQLT